MTLVDTSVWIDFFAAVNSPSKERLRALLGSRSDVATIDVILLEIMVGIPRESQRHDLERRFRKLICLPQRRSTVILAAEIYHGVCANGFTIRSMIDCLIAAAALEWEAKILHRDRDFDRIAQFYPLEIESTCE